MEVTTVLVLYNSLKLLWQKSVTKLKTLTQFLHFNIITESQKTVIIKQLKFPSEFCNWRIKTGNLYFKTQKLFFFINLNIFKNSHMPNTYHTHMNVIQFLNHDDFSKGRMYHSILKLHNKYIPILLVRCHQKVNLSIHTVVGKKVSTALDGT